MQVQLHAFLTSALDGGEFSASRPDHFASEKEHQVVTLRRLGGP
jgi:hypothetical protein